MQVPVCQRRVYRCCSHCPAALVIVLHFAQLLFASATKHQRPAMKNVRPPGVEMYATPAMATTSGSQPNHSGSRSVGHCPLKFPTTVTASDAGCDSFPCSHAHFPRHHFSLAHRQLRLASSACLHHCLQKTTTRSFRLPCRRRPHRHRCSTLLCHFLRGTRVQLRSIQCGSSHRVPRDYDCLSFSFSSSLPSLPCLSLSRSRSPASTSAAALTSRATLGSQVGSVRVVPAQKRLVVEIQAL